MYFVRLHPKAQAPIRKHSTDSGFDLRALLDDGKDNAELTLSPGQIEIIPTGWGVELPEPIFFNFEGHIGLTQMYTEAQVRSRSSLSIKGLVVSNSPGTIDYGYTGEIKIILSNVSNKAHTIYQGDRIAQIVCCPVFIPETFSFSYSFSKKYREVSGRQQQGFGSTGV
jgi:dUTP pyrophosphatase